MSNELRALLTAHQPICLGDLSSRDGDRKHAPLFCNPCSMAANDYIEWSVEHVANAYTSQTPRPSPGLDSVESGAPLVGSAAGTVVGTGDGRGPLERLADRWEAGAAEFSACADDCPEDDADSRFAYRAAAKFNERAARQLRAAIKECSA